MPIELLIELFDCAFGVGPELAENWKPPPPPDMEDIKRIEDRLEIRLPSLLVELSKGSPYFTQWFADLGPSRIPTRPNLHIIAKNEWLTEKGKPEDLVVITQAYDGDCEGISRSSESPDEAPVIYAAVDVWGDGGFSDRRISAPNFQAYLQDLCLDKAPRTRVKSLRRKAKKLIAEWEKEKP
jgi:hypothetical protein